MNFYSVRDLRTSPKTIWETLAEGGEVVITNNGKPSAIMIDASGDDLEVLILAIRQAKAMMAVNNMRKVAAESGYLTDAEIEEEISASRRVIQ